MLDGLSQETLLKFLLTCSFLLCLATKWPRTGTPGLGKTFSLLEGEVHPEAARRAKVTAVSSHACFLKAGGQSKLNGFYQVHPGTRSGVVEIHSDGQADEDASPGRTELCPR